MNTLNRRQVEKISEENEKLRPKFTELLTDEFILKYHVPQVNSIKKESSDLYTTIGNAVRSYVQPRTNGSGLYGGSVNRVPITPFKYYL
jgi:uncharacterized protein YaaN involved in tellurite resistance